MFLENKQYYIKIIKTKKNIFISICSCNGILLTYKSFTEKKTKDIKSRMTLELINVIKKLKKLKIKYINLNISNLKTNIIQQIISLFKTININIQSIKYFLNLPHNGCRKARKSRKRRKGRKKTGLLE